MTTEPKWSDFSTTLKGPHLEGKAVVWTIKDIVGEEYYSPAEKKKRVVPVAYFNESKLGLVLSEVNRTTLCRLFGNGMRKAIGQRVTLTPIRMKKVAGEERNPIRIGPAPAAQAEPDRAATPATAPAEKAVSTTPPAAAGPMMNNGVKPPLNPASKPAAEYASVENTISSKWHTFCEWLSSRYPYYADEAGKTNFFHIRAAVVKEGYKFVNAGNLGDVQGALIARAEAYRKEAEDKSATVTEHEETETEVEF